MNANVSKLLNEQINKEFYSAYLYLDFANYYASVGDVYKRQGVESAALDDVFELLAWNQGIGFFSSEIGPSTLFQAYKLIKNGEKQGKSREDICSALREKFGEKNPEMQVLH